MVIKWLGNKHVKVRLVVQMLFAAVSCNRQKCMQRGVAFIQMTTHGHFDNFLALGESLVKGMEMLIGEHETPKGDQLGCGLSFF